METLGRDRGKLCCVSWAERKTSSSQEVYWRKYLYLRGLIYSSRKSHVKEVPWVSQGRARSDFPGAVATRT